MEIMLCGTSKAADHYSEFEEVVKGFGSNPHFFTLGNIRHVPRLNSNVQAVSEFAVSHSDICVFIISEGAGKITWDVELPKADIEGIPIIIMASSEVMALYDKNKDKDLDEISASDEKHIVENTRKVIDTYGFSPTVFKKGEFAKILKEQLAEMLLYAVEEYRARNLRMNALLKNEESVHRSPHLILKIAKDEMEHKQYRKRAIKLLCDIGLSEEDFFDLLASDEQGVKRTVAESVSGLIKEDKPVEFYRRCFAKACEEEDVGLIRRLIKSLFSLNPVKALEASDVIDFNEIGTKHRVSDQLLEYAEFYIEHGYKDILLERCRSCANKSHEQGWIKNIRDLRDRLDNNGKST